MYWPSMSLDIDSSIALCQPCNSGKPHRQKEPLLIHPVPDLPWSHVSADMFDWNGLQYLIVVDSYSGWFEMDTLSKLVCQNGDLEDEESLCCPRNSMRAADRQWSTICKQRI